MKNIFALNNKGSTAPHPSDGWPGTLAIWLFIVAALIFAMLIVGGITRLTDSGLSIVHWAPVSGILPPLNQAEWEQAFAAYRQYPEYLLLNKGMTLDQFKSIYFWEYSHRLLGRFIGLVYIIPFIWFVLRKAIPQGYFKRLVLLFLLGGLQGAIGWWMVASGLVDRPDVAHERLAVHLILAMILFGYVLWVALDFRALDKKEIVAPFRITAKWARWFFPLLGAQITWGAFVAGLDAGHAFNTWPKMGADWIPAHVLSSISNDPLALINDPVTAQFIHRWLGVLVALGALHIAFKSLLYGLGGPALFLIVAIILQFALGVTTLIHGTPFSLAILHQAGAVILLASAIFLAHRTSWPSRTERIWVSKRPMA